MLTPFTSGCLTYPLKRAGHVFPALCPGHVTLEHLPLGQSPFLHCLRSRSLPNGDVAIGHRSALASHLGNIAALKKSRVVVEKHWV